MLIGISNKYVWNTSKCCIEFASDKADIKKWDLFGDELGDTVLMFKNCIIRTPLFKNKRVYQITIFDSNGSHLFEVSDQFISNWDNSDTTVTYFFTVNGKRYSVYYMRYYFTLPKGLFVNTICDFGMLPRKAGIIYNNICVTNGVVLLYGVWCLIFDDTWNSQLFGVVLKSYIHDRKWFLELSEIIFCTSSDIVKRVMLGISL